MASTQPLKNKDGRVYAYQIKVFRGRDANKKQLKPYSEVWRIPEGMNHPRTIKKELEKEAARFELECKAGVRKVIFDEDTISLCRYSDLTDMDRKPDAFTRFDRRVDFPNCTIMGRVMSVHRSMCPNEKFGGRTGVNYTMSEISPAVAGKWQRSSQNNSDHWVFLSKNCFSEKK